MGNTRKKINWKGLIEYEIPHELQSFNEQGYRPTLRSLFYRLFSKGLIPNTESAYTTLSKVTAKARSDGRLSIDCFEDKSRNILKKYNDQFQTLDEYLDIGINYIIQTPFRYINSIPKWHQQPNYVEVWIEKDAMANSIYSVLEDLDVVIVPNRGFTSLTFLNQNIERIKRARMTKKNIHICYFGDFDPSGVYMDKDLAKRLQKLGLDKTKINFQRIAITKEQIDMYSLPFKPDFDTREKMRKDSRSEQFIEEYGDLFAVELDALPAIIPNEFRSMVYDSVYKYYDREIYKNIIDKYSESSIKEVVKDKISQLYKDLQDYF